MEKKTRKRTKSKGSAASSQNRGRICPLYVCHDSHTAVREYSKQTGRTIKHITETALKEHMV